MKQEPTVVRVPGACVLCASPGLRVFPLSPARHLDCPACGLVSMRPELHPTEDEERTRYLLHRNSPDDAGYRAFLSRLARPLLERVPPGSEGLDFGCGPGPTLSVMLGERGLEVALHDPLFAPNPSTLQRTWDFVTCTEVVEHLRNPRATWQELAALVGPGGSLFVMTQPLDEARERGFADWAYARDPTHLALYRPRTLEWIARWLGFELEQAPATDDVFVFRRPG